MSERPSPSPAPSDDPSGEQAWIEADRFDEDGDVLLLVEDSGAFGGGFIAVGAAYPDGGTTFGGEPRVWTSPDGITWTQHEPDLGGIIDLETIVRLADGDVVVLGTVTADGASPETRAFRSSDGISWNRIDLPSDFAGLRTRAASGPIGTVVVTETEAWYSADMESWQRVLTAATGTQLMHPSAGDEGFVITVGGGGAGGVTTYASGDGLAWVEGRASGLSTRSSRSAATGSAGATPREGDRPLPIHERPRLHCDRSVERSRRPERSADRPGSRGHHPGRAQRRGPRPLADPRVQPLLRPAAAVGLGVSTSTDGETWTETDLPEDAYVSALTTDGSVVVMAGHLDRGEGGIGLLDRRSVARRPFSGLPREAHRSLWPVRFSCAGPSAR